MGEAYNIFGSINKTNYTFGNYNSSVGLPINLFNFSLSSEPIVLEMGANNTGEIDYLCQIAKPDYSLITNIQNAHIGNFKSIEDLIKTKISIFKNTNCDGMIFENLDDIHISNMCHNFSNKVQFSFNDKKADFFITEVLKNRQKLNKSQLRRDKYNTIKKIKESFDVNN